MIPVADAIQIVLDQTTSLPAESVALVDSRGRILAADIVADCDLPPFDRAQMDGYAIRAADVVNAPARLRIVGESAAGDEINAAMIATLASFGYARVKVGRRPRVAVMATGSELVDVDQRPGRDQIRDSNNYTIATYASLAGATVERLPLVGDNTEELKRQIAKACEASDMLITSGGVSMGVYDFTKAALKELGGEIFFERVALRPGKPTVFARLGKALVFGLPGNPVSVAMTFN